MISLIYQVQKRRIQGVKQIDMRYNRLKGLLMSHPLRTAIDQRGEQIINIRTQKLLVCTNLIFTFNI